MSDNIISVLVDNEGIEKFELTETYGNINSNPRPNVDPFDLTMQDLSFKNIQKAIREDHLFENDINRKILLYHIKNDIVDCYTSKIVLKPNKTYSMHIIANKSNNNELVHFDMYVIYDICDNLKRMGYHIHPYMNENEIYTFQIDAPYYKIHQQKHYDIKYMMDAEKLLLCTICMNAQKSILFDPCHHMTACENCCDKMTNCPICRESIKKRVSVYL